MVKNFNNISKEYHEKQAAIEEIKGKSSLIELNSGILQKDDILIASSYIDYGDNYMDDSSEDFENRMKIPEEQQIFENKIESVSYDITLDPNNFLKKFAGDLNIFCYYIITSFHKISC